MALFLFLDINTIQRKYSLMDGTGETWKSNIIFADGKALQFIIENSVNGPLPNVAGTIFMQSEWEAGTLQLDDDREYMPYL